MSFHETWLRRMPQPGIRRFRVNRSCAETFRIHRTNAVIMLLPKRYESVDE